MSPVAKRPTLLRVDVTPGKEQQSWLVGWLFLGLTAL